jgi:hypothetical protein
MVAAFNFFAQFLAFLAISMTDIALFLPIVLSELNSPSVEKPVYKE